MSRTLAAFVHTTFHPDENLHTIYKRLLEEAEQIAANHGGKVAELGSWRVTAPDDAGDDFHYRTSFMFAMSVPDYGDEPNIGRGSE